LPEGGTIGRQRKEVIRSMSTIVILAEDLALKLHIMDSCMKLHHIELDSLNYYNILP
jgi:hypothetical protein